MIQQERCTVILGVPTLFQMWLDAPGFASGRLQPRPFLHQRRRALPVPQSSGLARQKPVVFRQGYGLTEVGPNCFSDDR
jgi:fatty-acyl-CoA synthase